MYEADHVRTARAIGMSEGRILRTQVLRNATLPLVTMLGMDIGLALGGAIFVERAFGLPGIGRLLIASLGGRDLPVMLGIVRRRDDRDPALQPASSTWSTRCSTRASATSAGSQSSNARSKWPRGRAPTTVALGSPSANRITVGSESTP